MKYIFNGNGAGVPGLPHVVTQADIDAFNPEQLAMFQDSVASGVYVQQVTDVKHSKPKIKETAVSEGENHG